PHVRRCFLMLAAKRRRTANPRPVWIASAAELPQRTPGVPAGFHCSFVAARTVEAAACDCPQGSEPAGEELSPRCEEFARMDSGLIVRKVVGSSAEPVWPQGATSGRALRDFVRGTAGAP